MSSGDFKMGLSTAILGAFLTLTLLASVSAVSYRTIPTHWKKDIAEYQDDVDRIIEYGMSGDGKGVSYRELADLTDLYGNRLSGSDGLEDAIDYLIGKLSAEFGAENVHTENVSVPRWVRGQEWAKFTMPVTNRVHTMHILGIGTSIGTVNLPDAVDGELTYPIIIVKDFDELEQRCSEAADKIVVYNQPWDGYSNVFMYRSEGASRAAKCGAKAALVRSLTQFSLYTPHTGTQTYAEDLDPNDYIPSACITTEDADLLQRLVDLGHSAIEVTLYMEAQNMERAESRNLYVDLPGHDEEFANEYVIFGGHIDSWDVGTGAMDDAGGVVVSWQVLSMLKALDLQPKRTLRAIFWTAEEIDASGAVKFFENHKDEDVSLIMESDAGTFTPTGLGFNGTDEARSIMQEILNLLESIETTTLTEDMTGSVDIVDWIAAGFPSAVMGVRHDNSLWEDGYFLFHHTEADTMTVQDPDEMDLCTIMWTSVAYVVADLDYMLPRDG